MRQVVSFLLLLSIWQTSFAQNPGIILGKVSDHNGLPLAGVTIRVDGAPQTTCSDERGNYQFKIRPDTYQLTFSHLGFRTKTITLKVMADQRSESDISLSTSESAMDEVMITGVKVQTTTVSPTRVQALDVPQSISVIGQRIIKQQAAFDLATITRNVPGFTFTGNYSGAGSSQFFSARGFDLNETQNYRWNGMMVLNWGNQYADNIEQVEFLKGPSSILFGDVSPGGVINFVTKKPLADFAAQVNFKTGSWGLVRPSLDVTGPISKDRSLRYRLNASLEKQESFRDHVHSAIAFASPAIAWDLSPKLTLNLEAIFKGSKSTDDAGLVSPDGTTEGLASLRPSLYLGDPERKYHFNDQSYFATLTYELGLFWKLKTTVFAGRTTNRPFGIWFDQPDAEGNFTRRGYGFYRKVANRTFNTELTGTVFTGQVKHHISLGVEYQFSSSRHTNGGELDSLDVGNLFAQGIQTAEGQSPEHSPLLPYKMVIQRRGIHVHDQIGLFDGRISLYGGLRAGTTLQGNRYLQSEVSGTPYEGLKDDVVEKFMLVPRFGLIYKPVSNHSIYASYAKGVEVNSPDIFAKNYLEFASPPATISNQLEFGIKSSLMDNRLGITFAVFRINKLRPYGYVYLDPDQPNYDEYNVYYQGQHRSQGFEMEMDGRISNFLSVNGGLAFTSTRVIYDPGYPTGNLLPNAPGFSFNYWINYEHPEYLKGFSAGTGIFYKGKFYPGIDNNPNLLMRPAYTWDASASYHLAHIGVQINVMNLTNQVSYLNPWQFNLFDVKPLRQVIVTLSYKL